ncbi:hypothetical protein MIR68_002927 [Amoeboaphelidium protococcarum]|nr:hypothetical protein MIR68_002927 [Amoeboaphelidium protococcarum]
MFEDRLNELKSFILNNHPKHPDSALSVDALLDAVVAIYEDCKSFTGAEKNSSVPRFIQRYGSLVSEVKRLRMNQDDFTYIRRLAKGHFGEVSLVRSKFDGKVYAMKTLHKADMLKQKEIAFYMEEKQILSTVESEWTTSLIASFQDENNLYLVMDYVPGGDVASLLMRADEGQLKIDEDFVRFYIAEIVLALDELHKHNYVHRDLKPGNVLLDASGHVKLADFGSCIMLDANNQITSTVSVGTPDYISPEVLQAVEGKGAYGKECDFWSLGITFYELLIGDPPFYAESLMETYNQIMNHEEYFSIPNDMKVSDDALDLMKKLICKKEKRLKSADEIKKHPFFKSVDWDNLHQKSAPFIPKLAADDDASNFIEFNGEDEEGNAISNPGTKSFGTNKNFIGNQLSFVGFSHSKNANIAKALAGGVVAPAATQSVSSGVRDNVAEQALSAKLAQADAECEKLRAKLSDETKNVGSLKSAQQAMEADLRQMKITISEYQSKIEAKDSQISQIDRDSKLVTVELENIKKRYRELTDEKAQIEISLSLLKESFDKEVVASSQARESVNSYNELKTGMESRLQEAMKTLDEQSLEIVRLEKERGKMDIEKVKLQVELTQSKNALEEEKSSRDALKKQLSEVEDKLVTESSELGFAKEALRQAESALALVKQELTDSKARLSKEIDDNSVLRKKLDEIEKSKNSSEREVAAMRIKIEELSLLQQEKNAPVQSQLKQESSLSAQNSLKSPTKNAFAFFGARERSVDLSKQLESEVESKKKALMELEKINEEKKRIEQKYNESKDSLTAAEAELNQLKLILKKIEAHTMQTRQRRSTTSTRNPLLPEETVTDGQPAAQVVSNSNTIALDDEQKQKLEKKIAELQKSIAVSMVEIEEMKGKLKEEQTQRLIAENRLKFVDIQIKEDQMIRNGMEKRIAELTVSKEVASKEIMLVQANIKRLTSQKSAQDSEIDQLKQNLVIAQSERDEVGRKLEFYMKQKSELEEENSRMKKRIDELNMNNIDPAEFTALAEECNKIHRELNEMTLKYDNLVARHKVVVAENEGLKKHTDDDVITGMEKSTGASSDDVESNAETTKKARINMTKIKGLQQKLNNEVAKRVSLEAELEAVKQSKNMLETELDETKKQLQLQAANQKSIDISDLRSLNSSALRKLIRPILFPENGSHPLIQGWIKMRVPRNSKKTKFDWVKKYAVLKNSKLYLFEREKDKDSSNQEAIIDLKNDLFQVRSIRNKELIHLSTKELSAVFTVQVLTSVGHSIASLDRLNQIDGGNTVDVDLIQKKILAVGTAIAKEDKFREATEKMMKAATGDIKKRTQVELDDCIRRLKVLHEEQAELERQLEVSSIRNDKMSIASSENTNDVVMHPLKPKGFIGDVAPISENPELQSQEIINEIERKKAYKRGVENMLSIVTNSETKQSLTTQLQNVDKDIGVLKMSLDNIAITQSTMALPSANQLSSSQSQQAQSGLNSSKNQVMEHNGHYFRVKSYTPSSSSKCFHCHSEFFGTNQTLECGQCRIQCHKFCYSLIDVSCEQHQAAKKAMKWYFMAADEVDKMRWMTGLDCVKAAFKEDSTSSQVSGMMSDGAANNAGGVDIDELLAADD